MADLAQEAGDDGQVVVVVTHGGVTVDAIRTLLGDAPRGPSDRRSSRTAFLAVP